MLDCASDETLSIQMLGYDLQGRSGVRIDAATEARRRCHLCKPVQGEPVQAVLPEVSGTRRQIGSFVAGRHRPSGGFDVW